MSNQWFIYFYYQSNIFTGGTAFSHWNNSAILQWNFETLVWIEQGKLLPNQQSLDVNLRQPLSKFLDLFYMLPQWNQLPIFEHLETGEFDIEPPRLTNHLTTRNPKINEMFRLKTKPYVIRIFPLNFKKSLSKNVVFQI